MPPSPWCSRRDARWPCCSRRSCSAPRSSEGDETMAAHSAGREAAGAAAPNFVLDRIEAIPKLIGKHEEFLIVTGLAGTSRDIAALTNDGAHTYTMAGAMGGACMIGLGLA